MIDQALRDYWRAEVYPLSAEALQDFSAEVSFDGVKGFVSEALRSSDAILSKAYNVETSELQAQAKEELAKFKSLLSTHRTALIKFVSERVGIAKRLKAYKDGGAFFTNSITAFLDTEESAHDFLDCVGSDHLYKSSATLKSIPAPIESHELAHVFEDISEFQNKPPVDLKSSYYGKILHYVRERLGLIKEARNVHTYSDVTNKLAELLTSGSTSAQAMVSAVRQAYSAALIDEFQDTSPSQSTVFLALFNHIEGYFHIVGDPKQSIYRFRGADVYAYIQASKLADHSALLDTNYRSTPPMIHAVNVLFQQADDPFLVDKEISFTPSKWPGEAEIKAPKVAALHFNYLDKDFRNKGNFEEAIGADICTQILALIDQPWSEIDATDEERKLAVNPSDIAILVGSGREGQAIFNHLANYNVPAVIQTKTSLMETEEAAALLSILTAALTPNKPSLLKRALLTKTLGRGRILNDQKALSEASEYFTELHELWESRGLMPMISRFFSLFKIHENLGFVGGVRSITNLTHLAELLDQKSRDEHCSPGDITRWLEMAIDGTIIDTEAEVLELRLDSDRPAVKIRTQHSSKGLEFPITFVTPSCRRSFGNIPPELTSHGEDGQIYIAAQGEAVSSARIKEACADRARLAYVALTRSKYRCHFYYVPEKDKPAEHAVFQMLGEATLEDLQALAEKSEGCMQLNHVTETVWPEARSFHDVQEEEQRLSSRSLDEVEVCSKLRTTSFSGLTYHNHSEDSYRDQDGFISTTPIAEETGFWKQLQAGAGLGSAFHEILEEVDFQDLAGAEDVIESKLQKFTPYKRGYNRRELPKLISQISGYLQDLLSTPLAENFCSLDQVAAGKRMIEPQFVLSESRYSLGQLSEVLMSAPPLGLPAGYINSLRELEASAFEGMLTGFIDLIFEHDGKFHILDWKTNKLNNYSHFALCDAMADHHYYLQYHLYGLALDRFLQSRLGASYDPEKHLGNVYYVFLRGITPGEPGSGVFTDQISATRLAQLRTTYSAS